MPVLFENVAVAQRQPRIVNCQPGQRTDPNAGLPQQSHPGVIALRRYLYLLNHAEYVANQADCEQCGTYARFELIGEQGDARDDPNGQQYDGSALWAYRI